MRAHFWKQNALLLAECDTALCDFLLGTSVTTQIGGIAQDQCRKCCSYRLALCFQILSGRIGADSASNITHQLSRKYVL